MRDQIITGWQNIRKIVDFNEFLHKIEINMILLGGRLQHDARFIQDSEWRDFLRNYKDFGFIKKTVPNSGFEILAE